MGSILNPKRRKIVTCGAIKSKRLALLSSEAERLYWRLYMGSDNYGTLEGDPWDVKAAVAPMVDGLTLELIESALRELESCGLILRWEDDDSKWLHIVGHDKHQSADFLRKRGHRHTPKPPETPDAISDDAPALPLQRPNSAPSTTTTTTTTTTTKTPPSKARAHAREAASSDDGAVKLSWVHECADLMMPVLQGVDRNMLTQQLADAKVYGTGIRGRRKYEAEVFVAAARNFADALQSRTLDKPEAWWNYFVSILNRTALSGEAVDGEQASAEAEGNRIMDLIKQQQEALER